MVLINKTSILVTTLILICLTICGCSSSPSYSADSIGQVSQIQEGTILDIQEVKIKGDSRTGAGIGGLGGALGGSMAGGGSILTNIAGSIGGAIAGAVIGGATENLLTSSHAYQFSIELPNKEVFSVLQEERQDLNKGDHVKIYVSGNNTRIVPENTQAI